MARGNVVVGLLVVLAGCTDASIGDPLATTGVADPVSVGPDGGGSEPAPDPEPDADPGPDPDPTPIATELTQANATDIELDNAVSCNNGAQEVGLSNLHTDNSYYRVFDMAAQGGTGTEFAVSSVQFGIEQATAEAGTQPITVRLFTLQGAFQVANLTEIAAVALDVPDQNSTLLTVPITATVPADGVLVAEVFSPSGQASQSRFFIGSNSLGESAPTYLRAADCTVLEPTPVGDLVAGSTMHVVLSVTGEYR